MYMFMASLMVSVNSSMVMIAVIGPSQPRLTK